MTFELFDAVAFQPAEHRVYTTVVGVPFIQSTSLSRNVNSRVTCTARTLQVHGVILYANTSVELLFLFVFQRLTLCPCCYKLLVNLSKITFDNTLCETEIERPASTLTAATKYLYVNRAPRLLKSTLFHENGAT